MTNFLELHHGIHIGIIWTFQSECHSLWSYILKFQLKMSSFHHMVYHHDINVTIRHFGSVANVLIMFSSWWSIVRWDLLFFSWNLRIYSWRGWHSASIAWMISMWTLWWSSKKISSGSHVMVVAKDLHFMCYQTTLLMGTNCDNVWYILWIKFLILKLNIYMAPT